MTMSVIQGFSEIESIDTVHELAFANPELPRVIGIDVGQRNLALWFGMPRPNERAQTLGGVRFRWLGWVIIHCSGTETTDGACKLVRRAIALYRDSLFALASTVVIEKQHKKNRRMRAIADEIVRWIRSEVPHGRRMQIVSREARHKFTTVPGMPPMPTEYTARKSAALTVVERQTSEYAGERWWTFMRAHPASADDLADAALIAQDWMIAKWRVELFATNALESVSEVLRARRRRTVQTFRKRTHVRASTAAALVDDSDDSCDEEEKHARKRRPVVRALAEDDDPSDDSAADEARLTRSLYDSLHAK